MHLYVRLSYAVWLLHQLMNDIPHDIELCIMYDIACMLVQHLRNKKEVALLERMKFALPSFHAYGHKPACQVSMSLYFKFATKRLVCIRLFTALCDVRVLVYLMVKLWRGCGPTYEGLPE